MANYWDNDIPDTPPSASPSPADTGGGQPYWAGDIPDTSAPTPSSPSSEGTLPGVVQNFAGSLNNVIDTTLGAPVDLARTAINLGIGGYNKLTNSDAAPIPDDSFGGRQSIAKALGHVGITDPDTIKPHGVVEQLAHAAGEGAGYMVAPEMLIGALGKLGVVGPKLAEVLGTLFGKSEGVGNMTKNAVVGAVGGAGGQAAEDVAPDPLKPIAQMAGAVLTGGAADLGLSLTGSTAKGLANYAEPAIAGVIPNGLSKTNPLTRLKNYVQTNIAAKKAAAAATNPELAAASIGDVDRTEYPAGFQMTGFQASGDKGIGSLSAAVEKDAAKGGQDAFGKMRDDQNAVNSGVLGSYGQYGDPAAVAANVRSQLSDLDQMTQAASDHALGAHTQAQDALGGTRPAADIGTQYQSALEDIGNLEKQRTSDLFETADPTGSATVVSAPLKKAVGSTYGNLGPAAAMSLSSVEKQLAGGINGYGSTIPLSELGSLRTQINDAMRAANNFTSPNTAAAGRLGQLRTAVENAIDDSVTHIAAQEQQAVSRGAMQPEDTMAARLAAERDQFLAQQRAVNTGGGPSQSAGNDAGINAPPVSGASGTEGQANVGPRNPAGGAGVSENTAALMDAPTAARLRTAVSEFKAMKNRLGPTAAIVARPGATMPYEMQPGVVPSKIWGSGGKGADQVRSAISGATAGTEGMLPANAAKAQAARQNAVEAIQRAAASSLAAKGPLTPKSLAAWRADHQDALAELEKAAPGTTAKYDTVSAATDHLAAVNSIRKDALADFQKSALGRFIGISDPASVTTTVGNMLGNDDSVEMFRHLAQSVANDPDAKLGLQKALADVVTKAATSTREAGTSGINQINAASFKKFLAKNGPALRQVFGDEQMADYEKVANALTVMGRTVNVPGSSYTTQGINAARHYGIEKPTVAQSLFRYIGEVGLGGTIGYFSGNPILGAAASVGAELFQAARMAGLNGADQILHAALLDPPMLRALLMRASKKPTTGSSITFANRMARLAAMQGAGG